MLLNTFSAYLYRMKKWFIIFLFLPLFSNSQDVLSIAKKHLYVLSSDEMFGRGYIGNGYLNSVQYVESQFQEFGLISIGKDYRQGFTYEVNTFPDSVTVILDQKKLKPGVDYLVSPESGKSVGDFIPLRLTSQQLFVFRTVELKENTIVIVNVPSHKLPKDSAELFQKMLAQINLKVPIIELTNSKLTWSVGDFAWEHARVQIKTEVFSNDVKRIHLDVRNKIINDFNSFNVIGKIEAKGRKKNKDKHIVITAHLDHLGKMGAYTTFNGANDNASGVAMLLTLAEYFSKHRQKMNIVFIVFGGEEAGLIGSKYYTEHPLFDMKKIRFLLNLDLMGTGDEGITVVNATKFLQEFEYLKKINNNEKYLPIIKPRGEASNSDHYWFTKRDVRSFFIYTMGGTKAYHDIYDRPEQLPLTEFVDLYELIIRFTKGLCSNKIKFKN